jgi:PAS domain S-box-containing protein
MSDVVASDSRKPVVTADDAPIRVLHVDDETDFVDLAATSIERARDRITVLTETDAGAALDRLESDHVDCIVSDYDMPGMDGLEFLEAVRDEYPGLPFILYTGKGSEVIASEAISAGVTDYLQKEVGTDQYEVLANRIENAVAQQRTEAALEESERVLSTLMSNVPGMVYRCRNEEGWPMLFVSEGVVDLVGYTPEEIVDGDVSYGEDVVHPEDRDEVWNQVQTDIEAGRPFEVEYRVETNEGDVRWVWEQGRAIDTEDDGTVILEGVITDITERKTSEQELQTERDRLSALFDNSNDSIAYCEFEDGDPILHDVNPAFESVFGYDREEVLGECVDDILVPEDQREQGQQINQRAMQGERLVTEGERLTVDGRREFRIRAIPIDPDTPEQEGWVVYTDITEQKEREEQLQKAEQRYRRVVEQNLFGIYILQDGVIRYANPKAAELFGYEPEEMVDELSVFDITAEKDHERIEQSIRERKEGDESEKQYQMTGVRKDGTEFEFEVHSGIIEYEGEPALLGAVIDITERRERERELERHERMLDTVGDGVYILDQNRDFTAVNEAMTELTGYSEDELLGASADLVIREQDAEEARELREELRETTTDVVTMDLVLQTRDGDSIPAEVRFRALADDEGNYVGTAGVARDITDRRERQQQLERQNERLEEFAHLVSHDLKGPLNVAQTRTELLAETGNEIHFEKAKQAHQRMADIVNDVLDLARQGRTVENPEPVPFEDVAHQAWTAVSELAASLTVESDAVVFADRSRLQSLLENLFRNAIDHVGDDVRVEVGILPDRAGFYVADDGPGIPAADREQLFEAGHSTEEGGTGFGLSIVETIAGAHGWSVFVTDAEECPASLGGAQFSVTGVTFESTQ